VQLCQQVGTRQHLLGGAEGIRCEAQNVNDATGAVSPRMLSHALLQRSRCQSWLGPRRLADDAVAELASCKRALQLASTHRLCAT
jgi:hypothetical protein